MSAAVLDSDDRHHLAALAALDRMTAARLVALDAARRPRTAWAVATGDAPPGPPIASLFARNPELRASWRSARTDGSPERMGAVLAGLDVSVVAPSDEAYPRQLLEDPRRPEVLFVAGDIGVLDARRVAIVGTRNPTRRGAQTALRFGRELAEASVVVVSGLALGVDGAAHRGVIDADGAPPVAVVANGHDQPYPRRHAELWSEVAARGAVISEWPPGVRPEPFRFPQRNRILAALSEVVVVIESRERGGSLITAREAAERGIDVFAVPGPIDQRSSVGTNRLLEDGAFPLSDTSTLMAALGIDHRRAGRGRVDSRRPPSGEVEVILALVRSRPQSIETIAETTGLALGHAARDLARLEFDGWVVEVGGWYEAIDAPVPT